MTKERAGEILTFRKTCMECVVPATDCAECGEAFEMAIKALEQPQIVRCKDCKYRSKELYDYYGNPNNKVYVCQINDLAKNPDWYCANGERKDEDE